MNVVAARRAWLFIVGAMTETFLVYAVLAWFLVRARAGAGRPVVPDPFLYAGALALCAAALVVVRGAARAPDVVAFQRGSVLAMALLELNAVAGLVVAVVEGRFSAALVPALASAGAALAFVIPAGLAYFRGRTESPAAPPIAPS